MNWFATALRLSGPSDLYRRAGRADRHPRRLGPIARIGLAEWLGHDAFFDPYLDENARKQDGKR